jgi:hypothetical protein
MQTDIGLNDKFAQFIGLLNSKTNPHYSSMINHKVPTEMAHGF